MTMNRTVDVVAPSTYVDRTAAGILTGLAGGGWVYSNDLDADIVAAGGRVACKGVAFKALRNMGYPVATEKARHLSRYRLYADSAEMETWRVRVLEETFPVRQHEPNPGRCRRFQPDRPGDRLVSRGSRDGGHERRSVAGDPAHGHRRRPRAAVGDHGDGPLLSDRRGHPL